jgi:hypothetical protein
VSAVIAEALAPVKDPDDNRHYPYPPIDGLQLWSVTTVIGGTDYKPWIPKWYASMSARWCVDNLVQLAQVMRARRRDAGDGLTRDEARAKARDAAVAVAKDAAKREVELKSDAGTHVHDNLKALIAWAKLPARSAAMLELPPLPEHLEGARYDLKDGGEPPLLADVVSWMVDGFINFWCAFGDSMQIAASEMTVYNVELGYAGTLDLIIVLHGYAVSYGTGPNGSDQIVARPGNKLVIVVDAKTGKAQDGTWKEQLAAYMNGTEVGTRLGEMFPMPDVDAGAVLHLRPDYPDGWNLFLVSARDSRAAWERFKKALSIFTERQEVKGKPGTVIRPLRADGTMPGPRLCDVGSEGYGHALAPLRKALGAGAELEDVARFTAAELLAVRGIGAKLVDTTRQMLASQRPPLYLAGEEPAAAREEVAA